MVESPSLESLSFIPTSKQLEALKLLGDESKTRILLDGGVRSGKTQIILYWVLARASFYANSRHMVVRKCASHLRDSVWAENLHEYLRKHWPDKRYYELKYDATRMEFWNGSVLLFEGCDDEQRVRKLFGREYATIWLNEASELDWGTANGLFSRLAQKVTNAEGEECPCKAVMDTNPKGKQHWLYKAAVLGIDPETEQPLPMFGEWGRLGGWTPEDNRENIASRSVEQFRHQWVGVKRSWYYLGEWASQEGLIYDEFDAGVHVLDEVEVERRLYGRQGAWRGSPVMRVVDFGFRDPFVCLWGAFDTDGNLVIFRERYVKEKIVSDHAVEIRRASEGLPILYTLADHNAEDAETLRREGVRSRPVYKDSPPSAGFDRVKKRLRDRRLFVARECRNLIAEIESYAWDEEKEQAAPRQADHCMDALRYLVAEIDGGHSSKVVML